MKTFITVAVSMLVTLGGVVGWFCFAGRGKADPPTPVRVESPLRGDLVEVASAPGSVEPKTKVSISARVSARITELPFREGQAVIKGDPNANPPVAPSVLVRLDDLDLREMLRSSQATHDAQAAQLEVARARLLSQEQTINGIRSTLDEADKDLQRVQSLVKSKVLSPADLDTALAKADKLRADLSGAENTLKADKLNLIVLQHNVAAAEADVNRCKQNLSYTEITSPIDGVVTRIKAEVGEMVIVGTMNIPGTEILQVADLRQMLVVTELDEGDVAGVKVGQPARVRIRAYRDRVFTGKVDSVALVQTPGLTSKAGYFEVKVLLDSGSERIFSGLTADVDIETTRHSGVLKVPTQSVLARRVDELPPAVRDGNPNVEAAKTDTPVVYRFIDGKAVVTPVKIGAADATHTVVTAGLTEADRVIVGPYKVLEQIKNEQKVEDDRKTLATRPAASGKANGATSQPAK